jgi:acetyl-CoA C-acetyltransferase
VPLGATVPAVYRLIASRYLHVHQLPPEALAPLAVQLRAHAVQTEGAQFRSPITVEDVRRSRAVAAPLRLLDCCPVSDGGAAVLITAQPLDERSVEIVGLGQANLHQHLCEADLDDVGARRSARRALKEAGIGLGDIDIAGIYDSFTVTLAVLLEEIGFSAPGRRARMPPAARSPEPASCRLIPMEACSPTVTAGLGEGWLISSR